MMIPVHFIFHNFNVCFGCIVNAMSMFVILRKTPAALQEYSLLLLNTALVELISVIHHFLVDGRLFLSSTAAFVISSGPCHIVSSDFCALAIAFMNVVMIHSTALIALSFWYRVRILSGSSLLGKMRLQMIAFWLFFPHFAYVFGYVSTMNPREMLIKTVELSNAGDIDGLYGYADLTEPLPALIGSYLVVYASIMYTYIIWARVRLMNVLRVRTANMSVRTRSTHESLARILTIHAVLPFFVCGALFGLSVAQLSGYHSEDIEGTLLDVALVPALVNPILTLYFIRPYRFFITSLVCGPQRSSSLVHSVSIFGDHTHAKLSLSQQM